MSQPTKPKGKSMIVGIDPSLSNTYVFAGDGRITSHRGFSSKPAGSMVGPRMRRYEDQVAQVVGWLEALDSVDAIYLEGYSHNSKFQTHALGEYGGILRWNLLDCCDRIYEVAPSKLKLFATGKGNASKDQVVAHLASTYKVCFDCNDAYDAWGLLHLGLCCEGLIAPRSNSHRKAMENLGPANKAATPVAKSQPPLPF